MRLPDQFFNQSRKRFHGRKENIGHCRFAKKGLYHSAGSEPAGKMPVP